MVKKQECLNKIQDKAVNNAIKSLQKMGKALIHMATGTGKTRTAIKLINANHYNRILWLTHTEELYQQAGQNLLNEGQLDIGGFSGGTKDTTSKIIVATIQSISKPTALKMFSEHTFDLLIVDECHHAPAGSWTSTINYFKCPVLGLTATPYRPDKRYIEVFELFGEPVFSYDFISAVANKHLAEPLSQIIVTRSSIEGFQYRQEEFTSKQLEKLYVSSDRNEIIVKSYMQTRKKVKSPKAICFCINVNHAQRMAELFKAANINSAFVCGDSAILSSEDRQRIMNDFRNTNNIEIICAVNIFNEGVDIPEANIALMTRPTRSNIIYAQQIGRVARSNNGRKSQFHVLDFVDNTEREWPGYVATNMAPQGSIKSSVVTTYVDALDPVVKHKLITNIMDKANKYERTCIEDYQNFLKEKAKEKAYFAQFTTKQALLAEAAREFKK